MYLEKNKFAKNQLKMRSVISTDKNNEIDELLVFLKNKDLTLMIVEPKHKISMKKQNEMKAIIIKGVSGKSFFDDIDAVEWQCEQRLEKELPYS
jgi:hypothetical protein